jgi:peroxiredoxin
MFEVDGIKLTKVISRDGQIMKVFYRVFPPDRNARDVLDWLSAGAKH